MRFLKWSIMACFIDCFSEMFKTVYNDRLRNNNEILKMVNNDMLQLQ